MSDDYRMEVKTFDEWCQMEGDLFVFREEFLKYLQGKDSQMHPALEMPRWNFELAWSNYYRDVLKPQLDNDSPVEDLGEFP